MDLGARLLLRAEREARLGSRGLDLLIALLERPGALVTKEELIQRVWPGGSVAETNLRFQMATLRKVLGDGGAGQRYIQNILGRGYCFVARVEKTTHANPVAPPQSIAHTTHNLPAMLTRTIGRDDDTDQTAKLSRLRRFISIVGARGIGKTTVALAVAWNLLGLYADGARFVDLGTVADPGRVATALAYALGLTTQPDEPLPGVLAYLRDKAMLVVFDNCEHVAGAAAAAAEAILKRGPGVHLVTTEGEHIYRLSPLAVPPHFDTHNVDEAFAYGAIELFAQRARAALDAFELNPENLTKVCELCRRLDGNPLAIELAAARVGLGVDALFARLADSSLHRMKGCRTASPRQQTLHATLEWSHDLLSAYERIVFRRLAHFRSGFTDEMAVAIVGDAIIPAAAVLILITELVEKSLIVPDVTGRIIVYRLFETTRVFAAEKLAESNEADSIALRHALYYRSLLRKIETERAAGRSGGEWSPTYRSAFDDVRAAIDWASRLPANHELAFDLIIFSGELWFELSLFHEYRERIERALQLLSELPESIISTICAPHSGRNCRRSVKEPRPSIELRLKIALGHALWYSLHEPDALERVFARAQSLAESCGDCRLYGACGPSNEAAEDAGLGCAGRARA